MVAKKWSFYLMDATITLWSDHLSLKQFLHKRTLNARVNNSGVELSDYNIKFNFNNGVKTPFLILCLG